MTPSRTLPLLVAMSLLAVSGPAAAQAPDDPTSTPERVLFIGNSHTARNGGLDWQVANFARAEDPDIELEGETVTSSGVTLEYHWRTGAADRIRSGDFDTVVLQGHLPGSPDATPDSFLAHARLFHEAATESGARTVLFMTWPQARLDDIDLEDIVAAHRQIGDELDVDVAPAAIAMDIARNERPDLELIGEDGVHATWAGAYLAAATVYAALFGQSPVGLPYSFGVSDEDAAFLQEVAWKAWTDWEAGG